MDAAGTLAGALNAPKGGAEGATPPEGEGNPAEGGSSRVVLNTVFLFIINVLVIEIYSFDLIRIQLNKV